MNDNKGTLPTIKSHSGGDTLATNLDIGGAKTLQSVDTNNSLNGSTTVLERYHIIRLLGKGGMGMVYEVKHDLLGSRHAVKVLTNGLHGSNAEAMNERFLREAKLCASIRHPNLVMVTDCGIDHGKPVIVMDLVEGIDLGRFTKGEKGVDPVTVARIGTHVAAALCALHKLNIIHRDIKPSNIMVEHATGRVVLMDLGISRQSDENSELTQDNIIGTPAYMAPEQARSSSKVGPASDVFSLGASLAALLSARPPADKGSAHEMLEYIRQRVYASGSVLGLFADLEKRISPDFLQLLRDMTCFNPGDRITCAQAGERLMALGAGSSESSGVLETPQPMIVKGSSAFTRSKRPVTMDTLKSHDAGPALIRKSSAARWLVPLAIIIVVAVALTWHLLPSPAAELGSAHNEITATPQPHVTSNTDPHAQPPVIPAVSYPSRQLIPLAQDGPIECVLVQPGETRLGSDEPDREIERPRALVTFTKPKWIGRFEITCGQYAPFLSAQGPSADPGFAQFEEATTGFSVKPGNARKPVRGITLAEANAYCRWLSSNSGIDVRLPGEAEWEYAARGPTSRTWPWGETWRPDRCRSDGYDTPVDVGSFPSGASWCAAEDLAGNVFEWTNDWYDEHRWENIASSDPLPDPPTQVDGMTIVRGGCFANPRSICRSACRLSIRANKRDPAVGFRIITEQMPSNAPDGGTGEQKP